MVDKIILEGDKQEIINAIADAVISKLHLVAPETENEFMTGNEVTRMLRISRTTLYNWNNDGKLVPIEVGKKFLYRRSDVLSLIAA
jgi:excisionase family DNA binding protein